MSESYEKIILKIQAFLTNTLLILLTTVVFLQVITRKFLPIPMPWTEEFAKLSLIWLTYIGLAATFQKNFHIRIDLIDNFITSFYVKRIILMIINLSGLLFGVMIIYYSYIYLTEQLEFGQHTSILQLPMWFVISPLLLGGLLTTIHFIIQTIKSIQEMRHRS
mgnify:FL=1